MGARAHRAHAPNHNFFRCQTSNLALLLRVTPIKAQDLNSEIDLRRGFCCPLCGSGRPLPWASVQRNLHRKTESTMSYFGTLSAIWDQNHATAHRILEHFSRFGSKTTLQHIVFWPRPGLPAPSPHTMGSGTRMAHHPQSAEPRDLVGRLGAIRVPLPICTRDPRGPAARRTAGG